MGQHRGMHHMEGARVSAEGRCPFLMHCHPRHFSICAHCRASSLLCSSGGRKNPSDVGRWGFPLLSEEEHPIACLGVTARLRA
jgi:hypothetical protein